MGSIFISLLNFAFRPMSKAVWTCASIFDFFLRYEDNRCFSVSWRRSLIVQIRKKPFQSPEAILNQEKILDSKSSKCQQNLWSKINILKETHSTFWIQMLTVCQKVPKTDFQSEFSMSRIYRILQNLFAIIQSTCYRLI